MRYKINTYSIITFLFFAGFISAQDTDQSSILITTSSETQVPAEAIFFSITLSTQNEDPMKAFDEHKKLEKNLLNLIKEFEIADSNISYSLLNIGRTPPYAKDKLGFQTRQVVSIRLSDFNKYEPLQLAFLSNGIYEYNAKFTTEGKEEWVEKGIRKAISKAKEEAELTAKNLGKNLGK
ncbi:MAG: SIMPL domain-containing protein [Ignavibacteria bacterium]|nr:SIMPL domain-containing protein [Ignavibacteria bacterium]